MNFEPEPVSGSVKKSDPATFADFRGITSFRKEILNAFVNLCAIRAGLDFS